MKRIHPLIAILYAALILTATFFVYIQAAFADGIYVCKKAGAVNYQDCTDAQTVITPTVTDTDLVAVIYGGKVGPSSFWYEPGMRWQAWGNTSPDTLIGICGGSETTLAKCALGNGGKSAIIEKKNIQGLASAWTFVPPICYAKDDEERKQYKAIPPRLIVAWYCDRPGGIQGYVRVYTFTDMINALKRDIPFGLSADQKRQLDQMATTRDLTADELADANAFVANVRPVATVSAASGISAPVYLANADRTLGNKTSKRAYAGDPCLINDRLVTWNANKTIATGTNYYAVPGGYALCKITGAISK